MNFLFFCKSFFLLSLCEAFFTVFDLFVFVFDNEEEKGIFSLCKVSVVMMCFRLLSIVIFRNLKCFSNLMYFLIKQV